MSRTAIKKKRKAAPRRRDNTPLLIAGGVVAILVVAVLVWINVTASSAPPAPPVAASGRTWGKASAPVTIDEYADFQCPICGESDRIMQQIAPKYIDTGKAKVVFHNFAFIGQESTWAAEAASCAEDQGKFWEYANYVFSKQAGENKGAFAQDNLKAFASAVGLDTTAFNACFDSGKYTAAVQQEKAQAEALGLSSTPTFFINGQKFEGAIPADRLGQLIDSLQK